MICDGVVKKLVKFVILFMFGLNITLIKVMMMMLQERLKSQLDYLLILWLWIIRDNVTFNINFRNLFSLQFMSSLCSRDFFCIFMYFAMGVSVVIIGGV